MSSGASVTAGREQLTISPVLGITPTPDSELTIDVPALVPQLIVRLDRGALRRHLSRLLGRPVHGELHFELPFDLSSVQATRWNLGIQMLQAELADDTSLLRQRIGVRQVEEFLMSSLLYSQASNFSEALVGHTRDRGAVVRTACRFIEANLHETITVVDISDAVGVSVRTLQHHFTNELSQTPTAYVRDRRLDRVRRALLEARRGSGVSVSETAEHWGFSHLGRFAAAYRSRFGESPSATLRA